MNDCLLISIKTEHANKIFSGKKKYEFRTKSIGNKNINKKIFVYSSKDDKKIIGYIKLNRILESDIDSLLKETEYDNSGIRDYFNNRSVGYALEIKEYHLLNNPISLDELKKIDNSFVAPQFFRYIKENTSLYKLLQERE